MNMIKKAFRNDYFFSAFNKISSIVVGIITTALINRYLGPELKGRYAYVLSMINLVVIAANLGFYHSYPQSNRQNMENRTKAYVDVFTAQFILYFLIAVILCFFLKGNMLYMLALILIPVQVMTNQLGMVALVDFIKFRQISYMIVLILNLMLTLIVCLAAPRNILFVMGILILKDIAFIALYLFKIKYLPNPFNIHLKFLKYLVKFGIFAMISTLLLNANYKVDVLILGFYVDYRQIGLYSTGAAFAEYAWLIPDAFKDVLFSRTSKSDAIEDIVASMKINMFLVVLILIGVFLFGKLVLRLLYGMEYVDAYPVTNIIFLGIPSMVLYKLTYSLYLANGKMKFLLLTLSVSVVINIILNIIFTPFFGIEGAATASAVSYNVCGLIFYIRFIKDYGIKWYEPLILKPGELKPFIRLFAK